MRGGEFFSFGVSEKEYGMLSDSTVTESDIDNLAIVVPNVDRERLRLALEAFNGNVDNAAIYILNEQEEVNAPPPQPP